MITSGKILFYNEQNGSGIAITTDQKKVKFNIEEWNSYDIMPSLGLEISFTISQETATNINVVKQDKEKLKANIEENSTPKLQQTLRKKSDIKTQKYKNKELGDINEELNALLKNSSNNLDSLNSRISLSSDITETMKEYFDRLQKQLAKREGYNKVSGRLNYTLARRFLWTTFNNLADIDKSIINLRIKSISDDLKYISQLKDNFDKKIQYPIVAFEEIFLSSQVEYTLVKKMTTEVTERLNLLSSKEEKLAAEKKVKKKSILNAKNTEELKQLNKEMKILNGTYVDVVHMMAKLQEIHNINTKRLKEFESSYKEDFFETFKNEAKKYHKNILNILDAQAYLLDTLLWKEARNSPATLSYFKSLAVEMELNTKMYLKYYLSTLNQSKASKDTQELFDLYEHLIEIQKDYILIITSSAQDSMDYEQQIKNDNKSFIVKAFISELESIKWAMKNNVKAIILEDNLPTTSAKKYLDYYHNNIFSKPKIILLGSKQPIKASNYSISKILPSNSQPAIISNTLNQLMNT